MKRKDILDALNDIDYDMIVDAERPHSRKNNTAWIRWSVLAACLCLVLAAAIALPIAMMLGKDRWLEIPESTFAPSTSSSQTEDGSDTVVSTSDTESETDADTENKSTSDTESEITDTESDGNSSLGNVDNGVLQSASTAEMKVPLNMKDLGTDNVKEENNTSAISATVVQYTLDGNVVNWLTEGDILYVITSGNNRVVIIDSKSMEPVANVPLAGVPAEMNIIGDKIYISLPDLCRIDIFAKSDLTKEKSLYFDHEVSSFCVDGDYIYYSEHDQHCEVFRKNLATNEIKIVCNDKGNYISFYEPKLYLNKEDRILYIGESGSSGSAIYYYDANTLVQKSVFEKDNYGINNHTREIFHVGDYIFWGNYCLSDTNAKELIYRYGTASYGSVNFASEEMVSTYEGLFITDTCECVINYFDTGFLFEYVIVTDSYNVFFRARGYNVNTIIGVNFELQ